MVSIRQQIAARSHHLKPGNTGIAHLGFIAAMGLLLSVAACNNVPAAKFQAVQRDLFTSQERIRDLEDKLSAQEQTNRELGRRLANLSRLQGVPDEMLIIPERIVLASMSGGYDEDGKAGDDGIVVYVQPIDRDQHVVKVAGSLKVRLMDPQNPPGKTLFAEYNFDLEHTRPLWYGRLMTSHFTVKCPWPAGHLPAHDEIVAYVTFTDLLSGKALTATGTYKVKFPLKETQPGAR